MYSTALLDHFQNPRNVGDVPSPAATVQLENPACGDVLKLTARLENDRITEIGFRAKGCVPAMACGSAITTLVKGKTIEEARAIQRDQLITEVDGLPQAASHAGHLAMDTLAALLDAL
jgi:nitrogen fixation protein NifU and related proteins